MKRLLIFLLLLPLISAQPTDWFKAGIVKTQLNVSSTIDLTGRGPNPFLDSLSADVIFVPRNSDFVAVRAFETAPSAIVTADRARFEWHSPAIGSLPYSYTSVIETANNALRVSAKIPYPIQVPRGFEDYVRPTKNIDSTNDKIIAQAKLLAEGEDDLFLLVGKVAAWTKNDVSYNLSSLTADVSQPASWVLENRYGVCDEITSLFIAMLRSLKIPARFISGIAYTNSPQFPQGWGAHGWAEVYFPGVGWVAFDPTFGEFGRVDPGHIKLKESFDPQEPTTVFEWKARDVDVKVQDLKLSAIKLDSSGAVPLDLKVSVAPMRPRVGFGGYNGVVLDVENTADYYVGADFSLSKVTDMIIIDGDSRQIVLPPHGRGRLFWTVKVRPDFDPNFQYEIPVHVNTIRNDSFDAAFGVGKWDIVFSKADIDAEISRLSVSQFDPLQLACVLKDDAIWTDVGQVDCLVQNRGDKELSVNVCFKECRVISLPAGANAPVSFDVPADTPGAHEVQISAVSGDVAKKAVLTLVRLDTPSVAIKDVRVPDEVWYGDAFALSFTLSRDSVSLPRNVTVEINGGGAKAVVDVGDLMAEQEVRININSAQLYSGSPRFSVDVYYKDPFGKEYSSHDTASVRISGVPWYKRLFGWFADIF